MPRTKGATDIPKRKKARILAKKNVQVLTHKQIAEEEGVCRNSVIKIKPETVDANTLVMSQNYEKDYLRDIKRTNYKILGYIEKSIDEGTMPPSAAATAFGITFDKIQIKNNQPMQIVEQWSELEFARELFRRLVTKRGWSEEMAVERIVKNYPQIDGNLLNAENL